MRITLTPHLSLQEISRCCESLSRKVGSLGNQGPPPRVLPLHPGCGQAVQAVYEDTESGARKVVVTHWLADFSFSLPSIRHVIDSGLELRSVSERQVRGHGLKIEIAHSHLSWPWLGVVTGLQSSDPSRISSVETSQQVSGRRKTTTGSRDPTR